MMVEIWVPTAAFISISFVIYVFLYFRSKGRSEVQSTIRQALDKGAELTPEMIEKMSYVKSPRVADLRRGVVLVSLGLAIFLASMMAGSLSESGPIAMFPLLVGIGFLAVWKINLYD